MMFLAAVLLPALLFAEEKTVEKDSDKDGRIDAWEVREGETLVRSAKDTNRDGKPDQFRQMMQGRSLVLRSFDRNFDGRIDKRSLNAWNPDKKIPVPEGTRMRYLSTPGYSTLWREEDNDFDGKVDVYWEKGQKDGAPISARVGQPIDVEEKPAGQPEESNQNPDESPSERRIRLLNERHGLTH